MSCLQSLLGTHLSIIKLFQIMSFAGIIDYASDTNMVASSCFGTIFYNYIVLGLHVYAITSPNIQIHCFYVGDPTSESH